MSVQLDDLYQNQKAMIKLLCLLSEVDTSGVFYSPVFCSNVSPFTPLSLSEFPTHKMVSRPLSFSSIAAVILGTLKEPHGQGASTDEKNLWPTYTWESLEDDLFTMAMNCIMTHKTSYYRALCAGRSGGGQRSGLSRTASETGKLCVEAAIALLAALPSAFAEASNGKFMGTKGKLISEVLGMLDPSAARRVIKTGTDVEEHKGGGVVQSSATVLGDKSLHAEISLEDEAAMLDFVILWSRERTSPTEPLDDALLSSAAVTTLLPELRRVAGQRTPGDPCLPDSLDELKLRVLAHQYSTRAEFLHTVSSMCALSIACVSNSDREGLQVQIVLKGGSCSVNQDDEGDSLAVRDALYRFKCKIDECADKLATATRPPSIEHVLEEFYSGRLTDRSPGVAHTLRCLDEIELMVNLVYNVPQNQLTNNTGSLFAFPFLSTVYMSAIVRPTDFLTMRAKAILGLYEEGANQSGKVNLAKAAILKDIDTITDNSMAYNGPESSISLGMLQASEKIRSAESGIHW